jgi:oxalate---CoA ligase
MALFDLLKNGKDEATAIGGVEGAKPLTYAGLRQLASRTIARLNELGIGRGDRVAIVVPNGPEMAAVFMCIGAGAVTAPLNPAYRADEFEFYLNDLRSKALVVERGMQTPARDIAKKLSIPIIELVPQRGEGAGSFTLEPIDPMSGKAAKTGPAVDDDEVLVLHTSGTTSRPKIVPLLQRNLMATAKHIGQAVALKPEDVCLNIMPLFHIHGLMAAVLSSLNAGAAVVCTPGFNALKFFGWLEEVKPTWYTAVPTMHQAILSRAERNVEIVGRSRLRLIRSSSSSLPPQVMAELEKTFKAPVIESYGMTEASHQMASNPLPPRARKPGFVGVAAGPEIGIMDEQNKLLAAGEIGEIVIRGPNVTPG